MALTEGALYQALQTMRVELGGKETTIREGDILLGQKVPAAVESMFVLLGSTPSEITEAKRTAGLPVVLKSE